MLDSWDDFKTDEVFDGPFFQLTSIVSHIKTRKAPAHHAYIPLYHIWVASAGHSRHIGRDE